MREQALQQMSLGQNPGLIQEDLKGGTGNASGYTPATGYTQIEKALQIDTDSGHTFDFYNAQLTTRFTGGGSRDAMFMMEMKATPQMTTDVAGSYKIRPTA